MLPLAARAARPPRKISRHRARALGHGPGLRVRAARRLLPGAAGTVPDEARRHATFGGVLARPGHLAAGHQNARRAWDTAGLAGHASGGRLRVMSPCPRTNG